MAVTNEIELFTKLLQAAHVVNDSELTEAINCAKHLEIPLERALTMLKVASEENLQPAIRAKEMVAAGRISFDEASRVLQHANQHGIAFEEALPKKEDSNLRLSSGRVIHPIADFLLGAKIVTPDQLNQAAQKAQTMNLPLGKTLVINRFITRWTLGEVLSAANLAKEELVPKDRAVALLHDAIQKRHSVIQVLFESGAYTNANGGSLTILELLLLADCITEADFQDIEERKLLEKKTYLELITHSRIVESTILEAAVNLVDMIDSYLKPYQAAEALKQIRIRKIPAYQAIAELKPPPQVSLPQLRLGDLLVEAGIVSRNDVEKVAKNNQPTTTLVRIGKQLLDAKLIDDTNLYNALRTQSLYREGIISPKQAVAALSCATDEKIKLDEAFAKCNIYAPIRMQWNWQ